jgi:hypothetical protein
VPIEIQLNLNQSNNLQRAPVQDVGIRPHIQFNNPEAIRQPVDMMQVENHQNEDVHRYNTQQSKLQIQYPTYTTIKSCWSGVLIWNPGSTEMHVSNGKLTRI